jgi:pimeloyl-ACP methyl ester carboxylesterase
MNAGETRIELEHGAHTVLERWGDAGPTILCVHGMTSSRRGWARFANRFFLANRVYAYDQRGHGDAAASRGPMTLGQGVRDLERVVDAIPGKIDLILGHSWGGTIALLGALKVSPRRVVAVDPVLRVPPGTFFAEYVDEMRSIFAETGAARERAVLESYAGIDQLDLDGKVHALAHMSIESLENLGIDNRVDEGKWDIRERLAGYPITTLMPIAGIDSVVSAEDLAYLRERGGPNISVAVFENEGHSLHRSAFDEFTKLVESFL